MDSTSDSDTPLSLHPIGTIHTPYDDRYAAPRQPSSTDEAQPVVGRIELLPGCNYEQALEDLDGFERIWVIFGFDRNEGWKPKVLPPRSDGVRRGVFATRSPHRPNPIGISACRLISVRGLELLVGNPDILDGSPVYDIKPYVPYADSYPDSRVGWLDEEAGSIHYIVDITPPVRSDLDRLETMFDIHMTEHITHVLSENPFPHTYKRIKSRDDGGFVLAIKSWRLRFAVEGHRVTVQELLSGYPRQEVTGADPVSNNLYDYLAHLDYYLSREDT